MVANFRWVRARGAAQLFCRACAGACPRQPMAGHSLTMKPLHVGPTVNPPSMDTPGTGRAGALRGDLIIVRGAWSMWRRGKAPPDTRVITAKSICKSLHLAGRRSGRPGPRAWSVQVSQQALTRHPRIHVALCIVNPPRGAPCSVSPIRRAMAAAARLSEPRPDAESTPVCVGMQRISQHSS